MADKAIIHAALRVMNACALQVPPDSQDVETLRRSAAGVLAVLEPEHLAAYILKHELKTKGLRGVSGA